MSKIFFAIPSYRGIIYPEFADSFNRSLASCHEAGHATSYATYKGCCFISMVRDAVVRDFLKSQGDYLFFLDDDLSWEISAVNKLIALDLDVVAGVYRMKCEKPAWPVVLHKENTDQIVFNESGCIRASRLPTGFMCIKRVVLEKMVEHYQDRKYTDVSFDNGNRGEQINLFPSGVHNGYWESDDTGFCRLWENMGGEMWLYPDISFNHYGETKHFRGNYKRWIDAQLVPEAA